MVMAAMSSKVSFLLQLLLASAARFTPHSSQALKDAVELWMENSAEASLRFGNISDWNTTYITDTSLLFGATSRWYTATVTDMSYMFHTASAFNPKKVRWETSTVTDMSWMFRAASFKQKTSGWKKANVTAMSKMFRAASSLSADIPQWNTKIVEDMHGMFEGGAPTFHRDLLNAWKPASLTNSEMRDERWHFSTSVKTRVSQRTITAHASAKAITIAFTAGYNKAIRELRALREKARTVAPETHSDRVAIGTFDLALQHVEMAKDSITPQVLRRDLLPRLDPQIRALLAAEEGFMNDMSGASSVVAGNNENMAFFGMVHGNRVPVMQMIMVATLVLSVVAAFAASMTWRRCPNEEQASASDWSHPEWLNQRILPEAQSRHPTGDGLEALQATSCHGKAVMLTRNLHQLEGTWPLPKTNYHDLLGVRHERGRIYMVDAGGCAWVQWLTKQGWAPLEHLELAPDDKAPAIIPNALQTDDRMWEDRRLLDLTRSQLAQQDPQEGGDAAALSETPLASIPSIEIVDKSHLQAIALQGVGSFGKVYMATWRSANGDVKVAWKVAKAGVKPEAFRREVAAMKRLLLSGGLHHPNVLKLAAICIEASGHLSLVTEYCEHGSMKQWLAVNSAPSRQQLQLRLKSLHEVAAALAWVGSVGLVHCDVKMGNILIAQAQDDVMAKLGDFGLAHAPRKCKGCGGCGTLLYKPPEIWKARVSGGCPHSHCSDTWSLGLVAYGLLLGEEVQMSCFDLGERSFQDAVADGAHPQGVETCMDALFDHIEPSDVQESMMKKKNKCIKCLMMSFELSADRRPKCRQLAVAFQELAREVRGVPRSPTGREWCGSTDDSRIARSVTELMSRVRDCVRDAVIAQ